MTRRVLCFFPENLFLPQTGAQQHGLAVLAAMADLGCDVTLFSSTLSSPTPWREPPDHVLREHGCSRLVVHRPTAAEAAYYWAGRTAYHAATRWTKRLAGRMQNYTLRSSALCAPSMRCAFRNVLDETDPHILFMHYALWDGLVDHGRERHRLRIMDTHDLTTVAMRLRAVLEKVLPSTFDPGAIPHEVLQENFFDHVGDMDDLIQSECDVYDRYDVTLAVSPKEAQVISRGTRNTSVVTIRLSQPVKDLSNTYSGYPLFAAAANPFNVHGYYYLCRRVLPLLKTRRQSFSLNITGSVCNVIRPVESVQLHGVVQDLDSFYAAAPFLVNPVYGGTGQQVKIVDAMAHGVPVIALDRAAEGSPLRHGVNGLVACNAAEFAEHISTLWNDRQLCKRMGAAARETVEASYSPAQLRKALSHAFDFRAARIEARPDASVLCRDRITR